MPIVIDASMAMAWIFTDERDAESIAAARYVRRERALVPPLWRWEIQNVLRNAEKRGRVRTDEVSEILRELAAMPIMADPFTPNIEFGAELQLARHFSLTVYDAAYLELAARRGIRLATKDADLRAAAAQLDLLWSEHA